MKPADWPQHMREKPLASCAIGYFWAPPTRDIKAGFSINAEALGPHYGAACERARFLNKHLTDWRAGRRGDLPAADMPSDVGSMRWLVEVYKRGPAWAKVSPRSRGEYQRAFNLVLETKTKSGGEVGSASVKSMTTLAADKLYIRLQKGTRVERRVRQANVCITRMARAWDYVQSRYPNLFALPLINPFRSIELTYTHGTT